jgi:hypothetical protein
MQKRPPEHLERFSPFGVILGEKINQVCRIIVGTVTRPHVEHLPP